MQSILLMALAVLHFTAYWKKNERLTEVNLFFVLMQGIATIAADSAAYTIFAAGIMAACTFAAIDLIWRKKMSEW